MNSSGTEIPNELTGTIVNKDGNPVENVRVMLLPVGSVPGDSGLEKPGISATTDKRGRYTVSKIEDGLYNILSSKSDLKAYSDSVKVTGSVSSLPTDTLRAPGSISGKIILEPNHDTRIATVQILGTESYANVSEDGRFILAGLGAGHYRLRVVTTDPLYSPLFREFQVRAGTTDSLAEALIPFYGGIPVVTGIRAELDTLAGVATVRWSPVSYSKLQSYFIYRDEIGSLIFSQAAINKARIRDTIYLDTLYREGAEPVPKTWEYRVRVQNTQGDIGPAFSTGILQAVPPTKLATQIRLRPLSGRDSVGVSDSFALVAEFGNPTHAIHRIEWTSDGAAVPIAVKTLDAKSGSDTLVHKAGAVPGKVPFIVRVTDAAGRNWSDTILIEVLADVPSVDAGPDAEAAHGTEFPLFGKATDVFGKIVKWEWDIGGNGDFSPASGGDTVVQVPAAVGAKLICILRVTDDDGQVGLDTVAITAVAAIGAEATLRKVLWNGSSLIAVGDSGIILTSVDGSHWVPRKSGTGAQIQSVVWMGSRFVANAATHILASTDGIRWTESPFGIAFPVGLEWTGEKLVILGYPDKIFVSTDGLDWKSVNVPAYFFSSMVWTGDRLAITEGLGNKFIVSRDLSTWENSSLPTIARFIGYGDDRFLALGGNGQDTVCVSTDGLSWSQSALGGDYRLKSAAWGAGRFVAVGKEGAIRVSVDGATWIGRPSGTGKSLESIVWTGSQFVAVGTGVILTSPDGEAWTQRQ